VARPSRGRRKAAAAKHGRVRRNPKLHSLSSDTCSAFVRNISSRDGEFLLRAVSRSECALIVVAAFVDSKPVQLTYIHIGICCWEMARAATTTDAFNAIAEPRRREILDLLVGGERSVGELVELLGLGQPQVSKHLRVLREVCVVDVRAEGRERFYRVNGPALKPIHDWVMRYERAWADRFEALDVVLEDLKQKEDGDGGGNEQGDGEGDAPER
jgi:DNA-binding transcriptional ArsR family regulator